MMSIVEPFLRMHLTCTLLLLYAVVRSSFFASLIRTLSVNMVHTVHNAKIDSLMMALKKVEACRRLCIVFALQCIDWFDTLNYVY